MQPSNTESPKQVWTNVGENLWRLESSGVYYGLLKRGRKQFRRSLKTKDRALAKRKLNELREEVSELSIHENGTITFDALAERWLENIRHSIKESTVIRNKTCIKNVSPFFQGLSIRSITPRQCEDWIAKRGFKIAPSTFAHELDTMRLIFKFAISQGLILRNPTRDIKRKRILPTKLELPSREQFQQLLAAIKQSDGRACILAQNRGGADLVELLAYSGMRLDEARCMKWEDVSFERGTITITGGERRTKNYQERTVPMTSALRAVLERMKKETKPAPADLIVKIKSARKCLETASKRLGLPTFTHHDFRHFFATTCIESNVDIPTISKWLGHKDGGAVAMKTYGHLRQEHSFSQINRVTFGAEPAANVVTLNQVVLA